MFQAQTSTTPPAAGRYIPPPPFSPLVGETAPQYGARMLIAVLADPFQVYHLTDPQLELTEKAAQAWIASRPQDATETDQRVIATLTSLRHDLIRLIDHRRQAATQAAPAPAQDDDTPARDGGWGEVAPLSPAPPTRPPGGTTLQAPPPQARPPLVVNF